MHQPPTEHRLIQCLNCEFGIPVKDISALRWGADINSAVYKADTGSASYFVKVKQGHHHEIGISVLECLQKANLQEIIFPIETKDRQLFSYLDDFTVIVHPFVDGDNGFTHSLTNDHWIQLGAALKQVHELNIPGVLKQRLRKEEFSSQCRDAVETICEELDKIAAVDSSSMKFLALMKSKRTILLKLVDQARSLAEELKRSELTYVLCHSDIHAGNVLIDRKNNLYIVDWDDTILAPRERDLMFVGAGVGNVWNEPEESILFYQGYGDEPISKKLLAYYRANRILVDIAEYSHKLLYSCDGGEDRPLCYQHTVDMFEPKGVVEKAFELY